MKKSGAPIPCVMDGEKRFKSRREAARWIVEQTGVATDAHTIANNICTVISNGRGTVYGHTFADDVTPLTPKEMERRMSELEKLILDMVPYLSDGLGMTDVRKRIAALGL